MRDVYLGGFKNKDAVGNAWKNIIEEYEKSHGQLDYGLSCDFEVAEETIMLFVFSAGTCIVEVGESCRPCEFHDIGTLENMSSLFLQKISQHQKRW